MMIAVAAGLMSGLAGQAAAKPLKVFILAGHSNMQGNVNISTFDSMAGDPKTAPILKDMRGADGKPVVYQKVRISSIGCAGDETIEQTAPFLDEDPGALQARVEKGEKLTAEEENRLKAGVSNKSYHYLGAAKIVAPIGKAFAEAMVNMRKTSDK